MPSRRTFVVLLVATLVVLGVPTSGAVVNGEDASAGEYPWMVGLLTASEPDREQAHFCGGSLVTAEWVLTAAHCLFGEDGSELAPSEIDALVGTVDLGGSDGERLEVVEVLVHEDYDDETVLNDIGLIRLAEPLDIDPLAVAGPARAALEADGTIATVIGWGGTLPDPTGDLGEDQVYDPHLQEGTFPILDDAACTVEVEGFVEDTTLCAGAPSDDGGIDSCQGDSGGPLVVEDDGDFVLVGLVSYGELCGITYGVYTQTSAYAEWIEERTGLDLAGGGDDGGGAPVERVSGANRFATAAELATSRFDAPVDLVYVVTGTSFPDALAVAPVAALDGAPVLLVQRDAVPAETAAAFDELEPGLIVVVGGAGAVSDATEASLATHAPVERVAGASRYDTAALLAEDGFPDGAATVVLASGASFADALGGAAAAAADGSPLLLTAAGELPAVTAAALQAMAPDEVVVLGGTAAVGQAVVDAIEALGLPVVRIAGASRYETAALIATEFHEPSGELFVATGLNFPDGLVAGALGSPLLLVPAPPDVPGAVSDAAADLAPSGVVLLGGPSAVSDAQGAAIAAA